MILSKKERLAKRHIRVRKKVAGTSERPRLLVRKSLKHLYLQLIDDAPTTGSRTIATFTTAIRGNNGKHRANVTSAEALGLQVGAELKNRGIGAIVYDRGGYRYHGVVKSLADKIREAGIQF